MIERQYCASAYTIDFTRKKVLLMYNKKLKKWLQPGGHIENEELPTETAKRETLEETGVPIKIIGPSFDGKKIQPIAIEHYLNNVGDMIDIQFLAMPLSVELSNNENNKTIWVDIDKLDSMSDIEDEIKLKVKNLYDNYKKENKCID